MVATYILLHADCNVMYSTWLKSYQCKNKPLLNLTPILDALIKLLCISCFLYFTTLGGYYLIFHSFKVQRNIQIKIF